MEIDGERLRDTRERRGLSRRELAARSGIPYGTIWRLERGRQPLRLRTLHGLAGALEVEPLELLARRRARRDPPSS